MFSRYSVLSIIAPLSLLGCRLLVSFDGFVGGNAGGAPTGSGGEAGNAEIADATAAERDAPSDVGLDPRWLGTTGIPHGVAVYGDFVYWVETFPAGLLRAPKLGAANGIHVEEATPLLDPFDVVLDDTYLYWTDGDSLAARLAPGASSDAGPWQPIRVDHAKFLTIANGTVYVTSQVDQGAIASMSTSTRRTMMPFPDQRSPSGIAIIGEDLYWGHGGGNADGPGIAYAKGMSAPSPFLSPQEAASGDIVDGVAADVRFVYWIKNQRCIMRTDIETRMTTLLYRAATILGEGADLAVDENDIYFTSATDHAIERLSKSVPGSKEACDAIAADR